MLLLKEDQESNGGRHSDHHWNKKYMGPLGCTAHRKNVLYYAREPRTEKTAEPERDDGDQALCRCSDIRRCDIVDVYKSGDEEEYVTETVQTQ